MGDPYELRSIETGAVIASAVLGQAPQWYVLYFPVAALITIVIIGVLQVIGEQLPAGE